MCSHAQGFLEMYTAELTGGGAAAEARVRADLARHGYTAALQLGARGDDGPVMAR